MSREFLLCRHVPRLNNHHLIGNTDSEIIFQFGIQGSYGPIHRMLGSMAIFISISISCLTSLIGTMARI